MKPIQKIVLGLAALMAISSFGIHATSGTRTALLSDMLPHLSQKPVTLTQEDISNLTNPAVVRIINQVTGSISIPSFTIDWKNLVLYLNVAAPVTSTVNETLSGSGIIVNPNGYVLTNSHVIATAVIKQAYVNTLLGAYAIQSAAQQANTMSKAQQAALNQDEVTAFLKNAATYLLARTTGSLTSTITILNPSSSNADSIDNLVTEGFPASIISVNNNFLADGKDIGVLKINQQNLPAISLGDSSSLAAGESVYAVGFPGSADLNLAGFLQSTITAGSIDAIKPSDSGDFQLIQTDAKISEGSSGGPLLDNDGRVIGLTTISSDPTAQIGDTFAFGVPVSLAESTLNTDSIPYNATNTYYAFVLNGIALLENNHCTQAISDFQLAQRENQNFPAPASLNNYISQCQAIIANGNSIDTRWDEIMAWAKTSGGGIWWIVGVIALLLVVAVTIIIRRLLKVIKKEEADINRLGGNANVNSPITPIVAASPISGLVEYIKQTRAAGKKDEDLVGELAKAGWSAEDIANGLEGAGK
jgi:S1-C subfamily serine protease